MDFHAGELGQAIETLTAKQAQVISGNRVGRCTDLAGRVVVIAGRDPIPEEAKVTFERRTYTVSTHATHPYKRRQEPKWSRSELDVAMLLDGLETFFQDHPRVLSGHKGIVQLTKARCARGYHVNGGLTMDAEARPLHIIAMARKYVARNRQAEFDLAAQLKASRDDIKRDSFQVKPVHPSVARPSDPALLGLARPTYRPRAKWFTISPVPVAQLAMGVTA